ncbi:hypothetical protein MNEG_7123 [Monoraphidium neglectum]|uniref:Aminotransferase class I/classII large domain-containing protein n=1 Tax=Monoraphidium neglectum TaxID=145388 RepID=A0A0D2JNW7_9CHLO|nr:hypothetical protein MNEG_7123 [Monoraphidium neglectum]KIZ00843.1 hypothetical protein MNEG_7123 [Monoraphidium neglectum]|eukprot:XP_013899862.1 hypothetical protein MNEG_7123 [Monoraphidium neglectum]
MGYRVGYIAWPLGPGADALLGQELLKVQDTIPICPPTLSQHVALAALQLGGSYVAANVAALATNRAALLDALSPLNAAADGDGGTAAPPAVAGGEGAIYFWARLPRGFENSDEQVVAWLISDHGVCLIPGSACGCPGYVRAAFANLKPDVCAEAAARLKRGLAQLVAEGPAVLAGSANAPAPPLAAAARAGAAVTV